MPETPIDVSLRDLLHQREWLARLAANLVRDQNHAVDPSTLDLSAPLAPVGGVVLVEGSGAESRDVGRFGD